MLSSKPPKGPGALLVRTLQPGAAKPRAPAGVHNDLSRLDAYWRALPHLTACKARLPPPPAMSAASQRTLGMLLPHPPQPRPAEAPLPSTCSEVCGQRDHLTNP